MYSDRDYYSPGGAGGFSVFPPVIKNLLIINVAVFFVYNIFLPLIKVGQITANYTVTEYFALMPFGQGFYPWQLITYQFLHGDFWHLFFNMLSLWMFGMEIESVWGSKRFIAYYLTCGVGGALVQLFLSPVILGSGAPTIGASGAVFGILLAFVILFPNRYIYLYFLIPVKAKYLIAFWMIIEFLSVGAPGNIARLVHIGGAVTGFLFIMFDRKNQINFSFTKILNSFKKPNANRTAGQFRRRPTFQNENVKDAEFFEINSKKDKDVEVTQEEIDRILDKISRSGYQNLTEKEKKTLFEASKKN